MSSPSTRTYVGVQVREGSPHDVALPWLGLLPDSSTGEPRHLRGAVGGAVVVDVDLDPGDVPEEIADDTPDRGLLIEAGNDGDDLESVPGRVFTVLLHGT